MTTALLDDETFRKDVYEGLKLLELWPHKAVEVIESEFLKALRDGPRLRVALEAQCAPCTHAALFGWWGKDHVGTHCHDCHRSWTGTAQAHCTVCHRQFGSDRTASLHRVARDGGSYECLDPLSMHKNDGSPVFKTKPMPQGIVYVRDVGDVPSFWGSSTTNGDEADNDADDGLEDDQ